MSEVSVDIERRIAAPSERVAAYVNDFRNAKDWMVGIENIEQTGPESYRLALQSPVGRLEPEAKVTDHRPDFIRWVYTSVVEGEGQVQVAPGEPGDCVVNYRGKFRLKGKILGRAAKAVGMEGFTRRQGERSLERLKYLMEARRR